MFRKPTGALAVVFTLVVLAGCSSAAAPSGGTAPSGGAAPAGDAAPSGDAAPAGKAGGLITVIVNDPSNPYWTVEGDSAKAEAEKLGYKATIAAHKGDTKAESDLIDTAVTNKSVAIILDPADASGSIGAVQKAVAAKIPVFLVNSEINKEGLAKSQLVANNAQGAALGATDFVKAMGGKGDYVELLGKPSDNNAATRSNGYKSVLSQYPDMKLVGQEVANWDTKQGHDKMQILLTAHPTIKGMISGSDIMTVGAIAALKEAGKTLVIGSFDGSPDGALAIKAGTLAYSVIQPVTVYAKAAVDQADSYIRTGKTGVATEKQSFDCILVNADNIGKYTVFSLGS